MVNLNQVDNIHKSVSIMIYNIINHLTNLKLNWNLNVLMETDVPRFWITCYASRASCGKIYKGEQLRYCHKYMYHLRRIFSGHLRTYSLKNMFFFSINVVLSARRIGSQQTIFQRTRFFFAKIRIQLEPKFIKRFIKCL